MTIQILGGGCANCRKLEENALEAASRLGVEARIEHVTDGDDIMEMGVLRTPGYAVDGTLVDSGRVASVEEIEAALKQRVS